MRSLVVAASLVRARLRTGRAAVATVAALVLATAFIFTAAPEVFDRAADAGLRDAVASASAVQRNLEFSLNDRIAPGDADPLSGIAERGREIAADLPRTVAALVKAESDLWETIEFGVIDAPAPISRLTLRHQSGIGEQTTLVEGRLPTGSSRVIRVPGRAAPEGTPATAVLVEVALSRLTAEVLQVDVGARLFLTPQDDALPTGSGVAQYAAVEVVGIFDVIDPGAEYWMQDLALERPTVEIVSVNVRIFKATALLSPDAYPALHATGPIALPFRYGWRHFIDSSSLDAGTVGALAGDVTRLQATFPFRGTTLGTGSPSLQNGLSAVVEEYRAQRRTTEVALTVAAMGPAGASAGTMFLAAMLLARQRREGIHLVRDRGASRIQVLAGQLVEGVLISVPAAALGYILAVIATGAAGASPASAAAVAFGTIILLLTVADPGRASVATPDEHRAPPTGAGPQRLVLEGLVVIVALVGGVSLLGRGTAAGTAVDPFLAAVPLLIGLAAGLLILRLYPFPIRLLAAGAGMARGLVPALAMRNAARAAGATRLPLLVLLLVTAMGVFSSVLLTSIERGQGESAWRETGADFRVEVDPGEILPEDADLAGTPGMEAAAEGVLDDARYDGGSVLRAAVRLLALDMNEYGRMMQATPVPARFPAETVLGAWQGTDAGSDEQPIPAILSRPLAARSGVGIGDTFGVFMGGAGATFKVTGLLDRFPGAGEVSAFVIAPRGAVAIAFPARSQATNVVYLRGPASAEPALRERLGGALEQVRLISRSERFATLNGAPLVAAVTAGFGGALAVALVYSALAMAAGMVLVLRARRPQLALLRTLGLRRRQLMSLILLEHAPMVGVALLGGISLGLAIAEWLSPGLGLRSFTGGSGSFQLTVDPVAVLLLGVAPIVVVTAAVLGAAWLVGRSAAAQVTRAGEPI